MQIVYRIWARLTRKGKTSPRPWSIINAASPPSKIFMKANTWTLPPRVSMWLVYVYISVLGNLISFPKRYTKRWAVSVKPSRCIIEPLISLLNYWVRLFSPFFWLFCEPYLIPYFGLKGFKHAHVAVILIDLAVLYYNIRDYKRAEETYFTALTAYSALYGNSLSLSLCLSLSLD